MEKIVKVNGNYFKASQETELEMLEQTKQVFYETIEHYPEPMKNLLKEFPPWNFYEDIKGKNCFRVTGVDEVEVEEGKYCLLLHCFKAESSKVNELVAVSPKFIKKTDGWKPHQLDIISQCNVPEAFLRPLGYFLLLYISKDNKDIVRMKEEIEKEEIENEDNVEFKDNVEVKDNVEIENKDNKENC